MRRYRVSILVFALVALSAASSLAGQVSLGVKAGLLTSNVTGTPKEWEVSKSYRTTFTGGVFLNYAISKTFSLQPELCYASKGAVGNLYEGFVTVNATPSFNYIELPVLAKYTFPTSGKLHPCIFAGPTFAYTLSSNLEISAGILSGSVDISSLTHTTDFGLVLGGGVGYEVRGGLLTFDVRYERDFTNVIVSGDFLINGSRETISVDDFKNYDLAFLVGYQF